MTYRELIDSIIIRVKTISLSRGLPYVRIEDPIYSHWISQAESEIQLRTMALISNKTKKLIEDNNILGLPKDFGKILNLVIDNEEIDYINPRDFQVLSDSTTRYTIYPSDSTGIVYDVNWTDDSNKRIVVYPPLKAGTEIKLNYYPLILDFQDTLLSLDSTIQLPLDYYTLIENKVLSYLFPDFLGLYENEVRRLREYQGVTPIETIEGELG